jgi:uncharacterized membrane protein
MGKKITWIIVPVFAILVGLYPAIYFVIDRTFGLLKSKSPALLDNVLWNLSFYTHITFGGISLLVGWPQFLTRFRQRKPLLHRWMGKAYILSVLLSSIAGIYIGFYATGGMISSLGFICLGVIWFYSTVQAYRAIRKREVYRHQKMMIYSYAACFSAVTLRIYLPLLTILFHDFVKAYLIVAWLCWIPNIVIAYVLVKKLEKTTEGVITDRTVLQTKLNM